MVLDGSTMEREADAVVIGGGPAGYTSAIRMAELGLKPVLVERSEVGGTCTNRGCIPTKVMIHAARVFRDALHGGRMGIKAEGISIDFPRLQKWNSFVVDKVRRGVDHLLESKGVEVINGEASFLSPQRILLKPSGDIMSSGKIVVTTGSRPSDLPDIRFDSRGILSSDDIFSLKELPENLAIIGGGVIGVEMATAFSYLGSRVTIIELMDQILPGFDSALARPVHDSLTKAGVDINLGCSVAGSGYLDDGKLRLSFAGGRVMDADLVLVSVGRKPNTDGLGLAEAGVEVGSKGFIKVDERQETTRPGIYAAGDVTGLPYLAHRAMDQGHSAAECIFNSGHVPPRLAVPSVVYSDPEIAVVGMDEQACAAKGLEFVTGTHAFASSGRAQTLGRSEGFVKVLGERAGGRLLGVSMVGQSVSELIGGCTAMINASRTLAELASWSYPHPSLSEALMEAARGALKESSS